MEFSPFSVIVVSPFTVTGVVMFLFSQITLPEMVSSVLAAAAIKGSSASFPRQAERSAFSAEQMGQSRFTISSLHRSVQMQTVSSARTGAGRSVRHSTSAMNILNTRFFIRFSFRIYV